MNGLLLSGGTRHPGPMGTGRCLLPEAPRRTAAPRTISSWTGRGRLRSPVCGVSGCLDYSGRFSGFFAVRFLLPGALIAGFHYLLSLLGWDNAWMPVISVALAFLVVLGQGFIFPDRSAGLRDFFSISIFFVLTTPLLQYSRLGMDHYNFHLVPGFESTMMPYLLTLMVNLGLAWSAGLIFHVLRRWRYQEDIPSMGSVARAASVTLPPLGVVYAVVMVITNFSVAVQLAVVFAVLPLAFSLLLFLQESSSGLDDQDRRVLFQVLVTAACVSIAVGVAVIMSIYLSPDFPSVLPDHNLVRSWDLDFGALGFTREEALDRVNLGYTWHAIFLLIYMSWRSRRETVCGRSTAWERREMSLALHPVEDPRDPRRGHPQAGRVCRSSSPGPWRRVKSGTAQVEAAEYPAGGLGGESPLDDGLRGIPPGGAGVDRLLPVGLSHVSHWQAGPRPPP